VFFLKGRMKNIENNKWRDVGIRVAFKRFPQENSSNIVIGIEKECKSRSQLNEHSMEPFGFRIDNPNPNLLCSSSFFINFVFKLNFGEFRSYSTFEEQEIESDSDN
jgi:hypothetical protein